MLEIKFEEIEKGDRILARLDKDTHVMAIEFTVDSDEDNEVWNHDLYNEFGIAFYAENGVGFKFYLVEKRKPKADYMGIGSAIVTADVNGDVALVTTKIDVDRWMRVSVKSGGSVALSDDDVDMSELSKQNEIGRKITEFDYRA